MPGSDHLLPTPEGDVWEEKAAVIRHLYLRERKTLRQVKRILESQHKFPVHPLSTYETKIRDKLRLRKKLKRTDWPIVYHHFRNRSGKDTGIYLNNVRIPWEKAWKEIRRSGGRSIRNGEPEPLPKDVAVRTPSPVMQSMSPDLHRVSLPLVSSPLVPGSFTVQDRAVNIGLQNHPHMPHLPMVPTHGGFNELPLVRYTSQGGGGEGGVVMPGTHNFEVSFYHDFLKTTPSNQLRMKMLSIVGDNAQLAGNPGAANVGLFGQDIVADFMWSMPVSLAYRTIPSVATSLPHPSGRSTAPALDFSTYYFLTKFLYLLSNQKIHIGRTPTEAREVSELFDLVFGRLPTGLLIKLFESDLPTMRAAWEAAVPLAGNVKHKVAFTILMKVGLKNPEWIFSRGHLCLSFAASMGCIDIIQALLGIGVRADDKLQRDEYSTYYHTPAILEATMAGEYRCAKELIQGCDVNRTIEGVSQRVGRSNFDIFISAKLWPACLHSRRPLYDPTMRWGKARVCLSDEVYTQVLHLFLDSGANVDRLWDNNIYDLYNINDAPAEWKLSLLDRCFYRDINLYERLRPYSRKKRTEITRSGICLSAKLGKIFLQNYLDSRSAQHPADRKKMLELILAEQFLRQDEGCIGLEIIRGLIDFGVDIHLPHLRPGLSSSILLRNLMSGSRFNGFTSEVSALVTLMMDRGAIIDSDVIMAAVAETGLGILPELARNGADIRVQGGIALAMAARQNNFEAVSWLLQAGVDINADVNRTNWESPRAVIAIACMPGFLLGDGFVTERRDSGPANNEMLEYLIRRGAKLRVNSQDPGGFRILKYILDVDDAHFPILPTLEFCLDFLAVPGDLATARETLMELCLPPVFWSNKDYSQRLAIYELLFRLGCPILHESGLVSYISCGGRHDLIFEVLNAGADVNAYPMPHSSHHRYSPLQAAVRRGDLALVGQLVQRGAIVNLPARGERGRTALQAACEWTPLSREERTRQIELIKYLIDRGADVNAPAAKDMGMTALQIAALYGDMEVALLLLECGASVNAPPANFMGYCALDAAAEGGRLDMVKLLLNTGAYSHDRGQSGYEGAIKLAIERGYFAVVDLIREHIKVFGNCIIVHLDDDQLYQS
ncbi:hypothetical protein GGR58DRAFT_475065 [Xylaria digitata]|nr:hypothetical protein GGR58DRAFT_475065 [Xylaria digitata]